MKKDKKAKKDAEKLRKKAEKKQEKLQKKAEKKKEKLQKKEDKVLKKLHKKEEKKKEKIRRRVKTAFHMDKKDDSNGLIETLTRSVVLNKKMMKQDESVQKRWEEDYYNQMFVDFKNMLVKHNEAMKFDAEKLTGKIIDKKIEVERLDEQIKTLKEKVAELEK